LGWNKKQVLAERLFPRVRKLQPELAGRITGVLLEMDNSEVRLLLGNQEALVAKVDEAAQCNLRAFELSHFGSNEP
jgi:polyadenylate-binding protein